MSDSTSIPPTQGKMLADMVANSLWRIPKDPDAVKRFSLDRDSLPSMLAIIEGMGSGDTLIDVVESAIDAVLEYTQFSAAALFALHDDVLHLVSQRNFDDDAIERAMHLPVQDTLTGTTIRDNRIISAEIGVDERIDQKIQQSMMGQGRRFLISVPLRCQHKPIGAMNLMFNDNWTLTPDVENSMLWIGTIIAMPVNQLLHSAELERQSGKRAEIERQLQHTNAELEIANQNLEYLVQERTHEYEEQAKFLEREIMKREKVEKELRELALRDPLTGLYNFSHFAEELQRRMHEYSRRTKAGSLALVVLEIDAFKVVKDAHGPVGSNQVLQVVALKITEFVRKMDIACRFGGEEFAIILPECSLEGALQFAERLREAVAETAINLEEADVNVTISIGLTEYLPGESENEFIARANQALQTAQSSGANSVMHQHA